MTKGLKIENEIPEWSMGIVLHKYMHRTFFFPSACTKITSCFSLTGSAWDKKLQNMVIYF